MKKVRMQARVDVNKCTGCNTCVHVCPTMAYLPPVDRPLKRNMFPPCNVSCPVGNDVEGFVALAKQQRWDEAVELLLSTNPLPGVTGRICSAPCEKGCNRGKYDESIAIKAIERSLANHNGSSQNIFPKPKHKEEIAIIGAGPAGLSCGFRLARESYKVTIYEEKAEIGGGLRYGVPPYKISKETLEKELSYIKSSPIEFKLGLKFGEDFTLKDLDQFGAIYFATGLFKPSALGLPGEDCPQVIKGEALLEQVNSGKMPAIAGKVVVLGGGNTAVESARSALRLGAEPLLVFQGREKDMAAISGDIKSLKEEGIEIFARTAPVSLQLEGDRLKGVICAKTEVVSKQGKAQETVKIKEGSEYTIPADWLINASEERKDLAEMLGDKGDKDAEELVADKWGRTSRENIFAGGALVTGRNSVAHSIGSGLRGAKSIAAYLRGEPLEKEQTKRRVVSFKGINPEYHEPQSALRTPRIEAEKAVTGFAEIEITAADEACVIEAGRCFSCGVVPLYDPDNCRGCTNCSSRCPHDAIALMELEEPYTVRVAVDAERQDEVDEICARAKLNPESIVCYCTSTRAMEIAAAILKGAKTPEEIARLTGARTGCGVLCIEPIFRLMLSAGLELGSPGQSDIWYPTVPMIYDIPDKIIKKYEDRGFRFEEDKVFLQKYIRNK